MKSALSIAAVLLLVCGPTWAQPSGPVAFAPVGGLPDPLQSISGRFTSLNPSNRHDCAVTQVTGRVVSARVIMADEMACGQKETGNVIVNVQPGSAADAGQMVVGRRVAVKAKFISGEERRSGPFSAFFIIAEKAQIAASDSSAGSSPAAAFTSTMLCQPPELDALAAKLGSELCVQSTLVADLNGTGAALEAAARKPGNLSPGEAVSGDANAITCRLDREHSALHLKAIACARNAYWAWYNEKWRDRSFLTPPPP